MLTGQAKHVPLERHSEDESVLPLRALGHSGLFWSVQDKIDNNMEREKHTCEEITNGHRL
jgi:hypothetical protein